jgi:hypothetical protein
MERWQGNLGGWMTGDLVGRCHVSGCESPSLVLDN